MTDTGVSKLLDHLFRHESGKMVAVLSRLFGFKNLETAQDIVQDTLLQAMNTWSYKGIPENPSAWLYKTAKNKAIDLLRREKKFSEISPLLRSEHSLTISVHNLFLENEIEDSQLRMIFACCHPAIPEDSQVALTLKTLCGLSVNEIAKAYLTNEETIAKRIYRSKEKIKTGHIELEVPVGDELHQRLDVVLKTLYLLFNEGYNSSQPDWLIRDDLCYEAMRLCYILSEHPNTGLPRTNALLALICLQASRLPARIDDNGNIILLKRQDRTKWNKDLIKKGLYYIEMATDGQEITTYHLEAAIASLHAVAPSFEKTDWASIYHLYETLYSISPSPVIALNKAIASAYAISKENALTELLRIKGLDNYYLFHATAGEMYAGLNRKTEARKFFQRAYDLTLSQSEKQLLLEKISLC